MLGPISVPCLVDVTEITKDNTVNVCSTIDNNCMCAVSVVPIEAYQFLRKELNLILF